jgi:L-fuconolactonase
VSLHGVVPGLIDAHMHQWDPFTTPREATPLARMYRAAPRLFERLFPVLVPRPNRELVRVPDHVARPYLPAAYAADVAGVEDEVGVPVEAAVHVEADWQSDDPSEETAWVEALPFGEAGRPRLAAVVGHADPCDDRFVEQLDAHARASERFRGVRCMATWHPDPKVKRWAAREGLLRSREFLSGFAELAGRGLTFDAYVYSTQLGDVAVLADEYPGTTIVLDHFAPPVGWLGPMGASLGRSPEARDGYLARWRDDLADLAGRGNVVAKLSGLAFPMLGMPTGPMGRARLAETVAPLVDHTADAFGPERLVFGSNFPMDKAICDYPTVVGALVDLLAPSGEQMLRNVFRDNAERVYRL